MVPLRKKVLKYGTPKPRTAPPAVTQTQTLSFFPGCTWQERRFGHCLDAKILRSWGFRLYGV